MAETLNLDSVHCNGDARLTIGIRDKKVTLNYNYENNLLSIYDDKTRAKVNLDINEVISNGVMIYKGKYESFQVVQDAMTAGTLTPTKGWVISIMNAGGTDVNNAEISAKSHLVYTGDGWEIL